MSLTSLAFASCQGGSVSKESAGNAGDLGSIPGSGRSPGEGNGNSLQYSCLENPMDRGAWWATVHGVTRDRHDIATKPPPPPRNLQTFRMVLKQKTLDLGQCPGGRSGTDYSSELCPSTPSASPDLPASPRLFSCHQIYPSKGARLHSGHICASHSFAC